MDREYEPSDRDLQPEHEGLGRHHWYNVRCGELLANTHQQPIVIPGEIPVESACEILVKNGISSAPVYDKETNTYVGMFDYRDAVAYVLLGLGKEPPRADDSSIEVQELLRRARSSEPIPAKLAADLSHKDPFYSVMEETPLSQLAEIFGQGIHRVAVLDGNDLKGIISQSTVIQYLYANIRKFPELEKILQKTLVELGLGNKEVITVDGNTIVIEALKMMTKNDVSSVAIVDGTGAIVANLSMTDVKWAMKATRFGLLWETALHFVSFIDQEQGLMDGRDKLPVFDVLETSTLIFAVGKMVATHAHRIWVVDKAAFGRPVSVVTLTDVFRVIVPKDNADLS
ncbi:cell separation during budding [Borealophlyctis nickersoniae]|nr:cell separation during budding [Borealophlyctis nickersoniae]